MIGYHNTLPKIIIANSKVLINCVLPSKNRKIKG